MPTIELVDLPGIQLFPSDLYRQTTQLVDSYLQADNTLVLCVVDATIPSLDSSIALKMVRDANKLDSTILALTKADLIRDEESMVEHIFERVLKRSEEMADLSALVGCVAVVNRLHHDKVTLLEAEVAEQAIFNTMFEDPADAYAPHVIQQQLRDSTTTAQLIVKLDGMFSEHITKSWIPSVLTSIEKAALSVEYYVAELGPSPKELDPALLMKYVCQVSCIILASRSVVMQTMAWHCIALHGIALHCATHRGHLQQSQPILHASCIKLSAA